MNSFMSEKKKPIRKIKIKGAISFLVQLQGFSPFKKPLKNAFMYSTK